MQVVKYELSVPKEGKEVIDLIDAILEKFMAKAPFGEYAMLFGQASIAIEGIGELGNEAKSENRDELAGYMVHKLMSRLMPVK